VSSISGGCKRLENIMKVNHSTEKIWHLLTLHILPEAEEISGSMLFEKGATGIITLAEGPDSLELGAYFEAQANPEEIARDLEAEFARAGIRPALLGIRLSEIQEQDWMQKWKEGFEAINIGRRLMVAPSWKLPEATDRAVIQIDPGMAFGTGTHETTRLCLEAIERRWTGGSMIDVGTGTGILAIAAALLADNSRIVAIDVDPLAVQVATENLQINGVTERIEILEGQPADFAAQRFDFVVANLTAEVIIALMNDLVACLDLQGTMILSGILTLLREDVEKAATMAGLQIIERGEAGEWAMLIARRGQA
jgi:ribosomal protein L11 methyltransferase